jgi:hypothetical protein
MYQSTEGHYEHCATCSGPVFVKHPIGHIDFMVYCQKCGARPIIGDNDVIDAHEALKPIKLAGTLFRMLGVKETYFRD